MADGYDIWLLPDLHRRPVPSLYSLHHFIWSIPEVPVTNGTQGSSMLGHAVMHCRDVGHVVLCRAMLGYAVMHCRDVSHFAAFHAMPCSIMHCRNVSHFAALPAAQAPAQSQHWQASGLPTVGVHSTSQPYAVAPYITVTVPVCGARFAGFCPVTALTSQCINHCGNIFYVLTSCLPSNVA